MFQSLDGYLGLGFIGLKTEMLCILAEYLSETNSLYSYGMDKVAYTPYSPNSTCGIPGNVVKLEMFHDLCRVPWLKIISSTKFVLFAHQ